MFWRAERTLTVAGNPLKILYSLPLHRPEMQLFKKITFQPRPVACPQIELHLSPRTSELLLILHTDKNEHPYRLSNTDAHYF
jgi:hypothetical protein